MIVDGKRMCDVKDCGGENAEWGIGPAKNVVNLCPEHQKAYDLDVCIDCECWHPTWLIKEKECIYCCLDFLELLDIDMLRELQKRYDENRGTGDSNDYFCEITCMASCYTFRDEWGTAYDFQTMAELVRFVETCVMSKKSAAEIHKLQQKILKEARR